MSLVRVAVLGTVGRAIRINSDATEGAQIGVDLKLPDGSIPTLVELAAALGAIPGADGEAGNSSGAVGPVFESDIIDGVLLARVADNETIAGAWQYNADITMNADIAINWLDGDAVSREMLALNIDAGSSDPDFASVSLLLKATDPDGTQSTTDLSTFAHTVSFFGSADNSTDQTKFNTASFDVRATADYMTVPTNAAFDLGNGDWTIEFWSYVTASVGGQGWIQKDGDVNQRAWEISSSNGQMAFEYTVDGTSNQFKNLGATGALDAWHYVVIQRKGTDVDMYYDGVLSTGSPFVVGTDTIFGGTSPIWIGSEAGPASGSQGYMDDIRITKGVARYGGSTMTVPTASPAVGADIFDVGNDGFVTHLHGTRIDINNAIGINWEDTAGAPKEFLVFSGSVFSVGAPAFATVIDGLTVQVTGATTVDLTLDVTGALTALSYDGVLAANLLDKSAAEIIAGAYRFDDDITIANLKAINWLDSGGSPIEFLTFAGGAGGDPDFASVVLLMPYDGVDAATTAPDLSDSAHTATFVGNAQLDTAQMNNGTASLLVDGTGDWVTIPDSADFDFAGGDFTIDLALRFNTISGSSQWMVGHWSATGSQAGWVIGFDQALGFRFFWTTNGSTLKDHTEAFSAVINTWYQVRVTRTGGSTFIFVDGVLLGSDATIGSDVIHNSTHVLTIGALGDTSAPLLEVDGWIDDVRLTKGVARSTTTFTLPTGAWPTSSGGAGAFEIGDPAEATVIDGSTVTINAPLALANATFTGNGVRKSAAIQIDSDTHASLYFQTGGVAGEQNWGMDALDSGIFRITSSTDADGAGNTFLQATRVAGSVAIAEVQISGALITIQGPMTATSYDGILAANLLDKTAAETIAGAWNFGDLEVAGTFANLRWNDTDGAADEKLFSIRFQVGQVRFQNRLDDDTSAVNWLTMDRTGTVADDVTITATTINLVGALAATSYDGVLAANLLDKSAGETIPGGWDFGNIETASTSPFFRFRDTDGGTDEKIFTFRYQSGQLRMQNRTDADGSPVNWFTMDRTGTTADDVTITATAINLNGRVGSTSQIGTTGAGADPATGHFTRIFVSGGISFLDAFDFGGSVFKPLQIRSTGVTFNASITATQYSGILAANLLDKAAAEIISGQYDFSSTSTSPPAAGSASLRGLRLYMNGNQAVAATDAFLRLNQLGDFTSGVFTPGALRCDGILTVNSNANITGALTVIHAAMNHSPPSGAATLKYDVALAADDVDIQYRLAGTLKALVRYDMGTNTFIWQDRDPSTVTRMEFDMDTGDLDVTGVLTADNVKRGTGTPEAVVTGAVGDIFQRTDGGAGTTLYVKESGTGNTGWVAK